MLFLFATGCYFLLQEKLHEILNLLRKKRKEAQVILTHEKERVILCKVSTTLTFGFYLSLVFSAGLEGAYFLSEQCFFLAVYT